MITIEEFLKNFNYAHSAYLYGFVENRKEKIVKFGMIKWDDDEAFRWAGPFNGNHVLCVIKDYTGTSWYGCQPLQTLSEVTEEAKASALKNIHNYPRHLLKEVHIVDGMYITPQNQKIIYEKMTEGQKAKLQEKIDRVIKEWTSSSPTVENPVRFHLTGNDDCSYSAVFPNAEKALEALDYIKTMPLFETLEMFNFVFTN